MLYVGYMDLILNFELNSVTQQWMLYTETRRSA